MTFEQGMVIDERKAIKSLREKVEQHNIQERKKITEALEMSIRLRALITLVDEQYRGYGKSTALGKKAIELDAVVLCADRSTHESMKNLGYPYKLVSNNFTINDSLYGSRVPFLVEEGVSVMVIRNYIDQGHEFLGGFARIMRL